MKLYFKLSITFLIALLISSCTLDVQDEFNFQPDLISPDDPFQNMTAWEFIGSRRSNSIVDPDTGARDLGGFNENNLDYFRAAVQAAGLESLYMQTNTEDRTYLLFSNRAFINGNNERNPNVIINGSLGAAPRNVNLDTFFDDLTTEEMNRLRAMIRYHIIDGEQVNQATSIPRINVFREFNSLLPRVDVNQRTQEIIGLSDEVNPIFVELRERLVLVINPLRSGVNPGITTSDFEQTVVQHNFVFNNGIGHVIEGTARAQEYSLYNNFDLSIPNN